MDRGRRVTLDNAGLGYRTRNYADSYTARPLQPVTPKFVSDMLVVEQPKDQEITNEQIVERARAIVAPQVTVEPLPARSIVQPVLQTPVPQLVTRPVRNIEPDTKPIEELVSSIQLSSRTTAFDKQMEQASLGDRETQKKGNFTARGLFAHKRSIVLSGMALVLFFGGFSALVMSVGSNKAVIQQAQALSEVVPEENTTGESAGIGDLSEEPIPESGIRSYSVAANHPKFIRIGELGGKSSRILRMGVDKNNAISNPRSIWDAGWYDGSSLPGDKVGASLILGHVSGPNDPGIFYNLYRLKEGDIIEVEMGDGTVYEYRVVGKEEVSTDSINMNDYLVSKDIDKPGLTLMTCAGEFNPSTQQYENRLAVFAVRTN